MLSDKQEERALNSFKSACEEHDGKVSEGDNWAHCTLDNFEADLKIGRGEDLPNLGRIHTKNGSTIDVHGVEHTRMSPFGMSTGISDEGVKVNDDGTIKDVVIVRGNPWK